MIMIRKAGLKDAKPIATYLLMAMKEIVYHFIGEEDPEKAIAFMLHFVERDNNQYSYQNCWVAENDGEVVAAVNIYNGARLTELRQPVIEYVRSLNKDYIFEDETQPGEYYIDSIGVNPNQRNKGIGMKLLQFVMDEYVNKRNQTLGLLVDEANPDAKRLYEKLGFTCAGKKALFGKRMEHLQIKVDHLKAGQAE